MSKVRMRRKECCMVKVKGWTGLGMFDWGWRMRIILSQGAQYIDVSQLPRRRADRANRFLHLAQRGKFWQFFPLKFSLRLHHRSKQPSNKKIKKYRMATSGHLSYWPFDASTRFLIYLIIIDRWWEVITPYFFFLTVMLTESKLEGNTAQIFPTRIIVYNYALV